MEYIFNIRAQFKKESETQVKTQWLTIKHKLETDQAYALNIPVVINPNSLNTKELQNKLNEISKQITFNISSTNITTDGLSDVQGKAKQASEAVENVNQSLWRTSEAAKQVSENFRFNSGTYGSELKNLGISEESIEKAKKQLEDLKLTIDKVTSKQSTTTGADGAEKTHTLLIQATDQYKRLVTLSQTFKNDEGQVKTEVLSITENLKQQAQAQEKINRAYNQQKVAMEDTMAAARELWSLQNDRKNSISSVGVINTAGKDELPSLSAPDDVSKKTQDFIKAYNDWIKVIQKANDELNKQRRITDETTVALERTEKAALTASRNALSERTTQTDFRTKDVAAEIEKATAELTVFEKELSKVGMGLDDVRNKENETLRDLLQTAKATSSSNAFGKYLDQLAIAKAKLREVKAEQDNAGESIKKLQDLTSKGLFAQNPNDDRVKTLRQDIGDLATTYQQLQTQFQNEGMTESVRQGFAQLSGQLQSTSERAKELQSSLKSAKDAAALEDRKSNLNNKIETWLRNNTRASESMRQSMKSLQTQIQSADKQTLTHLTQQFNELNRTAQQTGQIGKSFMDTFKEKALKFAGWFNLANAFMMITNEGKQALITFKEVDSILTEISKTSERSAESLEKLGETAFDAASKYGVSVQNYLTGVQEMARAGYEIYGEERSAELAELALLIQSAGDTTAQAAQEAIIATDAAFQLGGNVEELTKVFNSLNKITNNTAINMNEMAIGIKEAASIAHQYGVSIEDTASLIAIAEARTKQGGAQVGNAIKSLLVTLTDVTNSTVTKAFDAVGVSMYKFIDGSKQLKTPIELLGELSKVFNELPQGDDRRSILLNDIGGMQIYHYVQKCA